MHLLINLFNYSLNGDSYSILGIVLASGDTVDFQVPYGSESCLGKKVNNQVNIQIKQNYNYDRCYEGKTQVCVYMVRRSYNQIFRQKK